MVFQCPADFHFRNRSHDKRHFYGKLKGAGTFFSDTIQQ